MEEVEFTKKQLSEICAICNHKLGCHLMLKAGMCEKCYDEKGSDNYKHHIFKVKIKSKEV